MKREKKKSSGKMVVVPLQEWCAVGFPEFFVGQDKIRLSRWIRSMATNGFINAEKDEVSFPESIDRSRKINLADIVPYLTFTPRDLEDSRLFEASVGGDLAVPPRTHLARLYDVPKVGIVLISEIDYANSNVINYVAEETLNVTINGLQASMFVLMDAAENIRAILNWYTKTMGYELQIWTNQLTKSELRSLFEHLVSHFTAGFS